MLEKYRDDINSAKTKRGKEALTHHSKYALSALKNEINGNNDDKIVFKKIHKTLSYESVLYNYLKGKYPLMKVLKDIPQLNSNIRTYLMGNSKFKEKQICYFFKPQIVFFYIAIIKCTDCVDESEHQKIIDEAKEDWPELREALINEDKYVMQKVPDDVSDVEKCKYENGDGKLNMKAILNIFEHECMEKGMAAVDIAAEWMKFFSLKFTNIEIEMSVIDHGNENDQAESDQTEMEIEIT